MDLNHDCQREISHVYIRLNPIHVELAETKRLNPETRDPVIVY